MKLIRSLVSLHLVLSRCPVESFAPNALTSFRKRPSRLFSPRQSISRCSEREVICHDEEGVIVNAKNKTSSDLASPSSAQQPPLFHGGPIKRQLALSWCNHDGCSEAVRERVVGEHNHMELTGPATGQVVYSLIERDPKEGKAVNPPSVLLLIKRGEQELLDIAIDTVQQLTSRGVRVLVDSKLRNKLDECDAVDTDGDLLGHFDPKKRAAGFGFGSGEELFATANGGVPKDADPDLIVTLGGDGLLMWAAHVFSGPGKHRGACGGSARTAPVDGALTPCFLSQLPRYYQVHTFLNRATGQRRSLSPVVLSSCTLSLSLGACEVAGGTMGFLTPFAREEMLETILISLGLTEGVDERKEEENGDAGADADKAAPGGLFLTQRANNNMQIEAATRDGYNEEFRSSFGSNHQICISMRMRLDCRVFGEDGSLKCRYAVLNEVVVDRGSSLYLASLVSVPHRRVGGCDTALSAWRCQREGCQRNGQ